jgi:hypothetical protein
MPGLRARVDCIPTFPFLLFLFVYLLHLCILICKLKSLYFCLFAFFNIFRIVWQYLQLLRDFQLFHLGNINLLDFLIMVLHWTKSMQLNNFLAVIFFVFDMVAFFVNLLYCTRIELSIARVNGFAHISLLE